MMFISWCVAEQMELQLHSKYLFLRRLSCEGVKTMSSGIKNHHFEKQFVKETTTL